MHENPVAGVINGCQDAQAGDSVGLRMSHLNRDYSSRRIN